MFVLTTKILTVENLENIKKFKIQEIKDLFWFHHSGIISTVVKILAYFTVHIQ